MSGNDVIEPGEGTIERGRASTEVGATSDPRLGDAFLEHLGTQWACEPHAVDVPEDGGEPG